MKIPRDVSGTALLAALRRLGYEPVRQRGSDVRITTQEGGEHHEVLPLHNSIRAKTLSSILKSIANHHGISVQDLLRKLVFKSGARFQCDQDIMKITVELDDRLVREAEELANQEGEPLADLVGRALEVYVMAKRGKKMSFAPLTKGGHPVPGVDIDNRVSLYDCMDRRD